jgi:hypothetical protein
LPSSQVTPEASGSGVEASNGWGSQVHAAEPAALPVASAALPVAGVALPVAGVALPVAGAGGADFPHATSAKATQHLTHAL